MPHVRKGIGTRCYRIFLLLLLLQLAIISLAWTVDNLAPDPVIRFPNDVIVWNARQGDARRLLVSNAPETITSLTAPVLWHDEVKGAGDVTETKHRVFIWHTNGFEEIPIRIGITVENLANEHGLMLTDCRGISITGAASDSLNKVGIPMVKSALGIANASDMTPSQPSIAPAGSNTGPYIRGVEGWDIAPRQVLGALIEFTVIKENVSAPGNLHYMVRVVAGKAYKTMTGNVQLREGEEGKGIAPLEKRQLAGQLIPMHTRGSWAFSTVVADNQLHPYLHSKKPGYAFITFLGAKDLLMTQGNSYDPEHASPEGNAGNWGVTYQVNLYVALPPGMTQPGKVVMRFIGLDTSPDDGKEAFAYAGACRIGNEKIRLIPILKWGTKRDSTSVVWTFQPQSGTVANLQFELMHAGGSCLPVGIQLKGI